ncbi:MAG TPA: isochorismatase family cysteine hydrolase [Hyphomicrobiales bacterium]|nr:isochorismatase family cysteine hydrolase [Hyphomicrobiales bacterium]
MDKYTEPHFDTSALITIDVQNDFTLPDAPARIPGTAEVVPNVVRLLQAYRRRGLPIVHMVRLYQRDGANVDVCRRELIENGKAIAAPGTDGAELVAALQPESHARLDAALLLSGAPQQIGPNEFALYKPRWGAFYQTVLEDFLRERHVDTLVFCGCNYPNCPRTSIYQASERDFRLALASDAMSQVYAKGEEEMANIGVSLLETGSLEERLK